MQELNNISKHIFELLHEHDCVIIPDFGGFVANYLPARLDELNNRVFPPSKHLLFNKNLINNDGLLAHRISSEEGVSYESALEKLAAYAKALEETKGIKIDRTGIIWLKAHTRSKSKKKGVYQGKGWQIRVVDDIDNNFELFKMIYKLYSLENPTVEPIYNSYPTTIKL